MRKQLKTLYHNSTIGHLILTPIIKFWNYYCPHVLPDKTYIKQNFKNTFGYKVNLENPKTLNEKVQWLQLNDRTPLRTLCTDKYAVRGYVKDKIGKQHLIPLVYHSDSPAKIIPENLPNYPFIIKTNHGCGGHVVVRDKTKIDWDITQKKIKKLLKKNYYYKSKEWQYKNIKPCIVVEKLLMNPNFEIPREYKFHCCNGKVNFIEVYIDKYANKKLNFYDPDWNFLDCRVSSVENSKYCEKPKTLNKMKSLAENLARDFIFVRVDLYSFNSGIYFGELTFTPVGGMQKYIPSKWNIIFGDKLTL